MLVVRNTTGKIGVFSFDSFTYISSFLSEKDDGCNNCFVGEGAHIIDASWKGMVSIFDINSGERIILYELDSNNEFPVGIICLDEDSYLITLCGIGAGNSRFIIVNKPLKKPDIICPMPNIKVKIMSKVSYNNINKCLIFCSNGFVYMYTVYEFIKTIAVDGRASEAVWSPDGKYIITFNELNELIVFNPINGAILKCLQKTKNLRRVRFTNNAKYLILHDWDGSEFILWDEFISDII